MYSARRLCDDVRGRGFHFRLAGEVTPERGSTKTGVTQLTCAILRVTRIAIDDRKRGALLREPSSDELAHLSDTSDAGQDHSLRCVSHRVIC